LMSVRLVGRHAGGLYDAEYFLRDPIAPRRWN
jgi:hypothetical protein